MVLLKAKSFELASGDQVSFLLPFAAIENIYAAVNKAFEHKKKVKHFEKFIAPLLT